MILLVESGETMSKLIDVEDWLDQWMSVSIASQRLHGEGMVMTPVSSHPYWRASPIPNRRQLT